MGNICIVIKNLAAVAVSFWCVHQAFHALGTNQTYTMTKVDSTSKEGQTETKTDRQTESVKSKS